MKLTELLYPFAFLPVCLVLYYVLPKRCRNAALLAASLLFFAWGTPEYLVLLVLAILLNYFAGLELESLLEDGKTGHARLVLVLTILADLLPLLFFKYYGEAAAALNRVFVLSLPVHALPAPVGVSFYTFTLLSALSDVYHGRAPMEKNLIRFALFVSFFPKLTSGPIVQYADMQPQLEPHEFVRERVGSGMRLFVIGLAKKVILAGLLGTPFYALKALGPQALSVCGAWLGALLYALMLYFDFSGYSDMAIGLGRMLGFRFPENFRYPYLCSSISDFWRRWHISLGSWFKEYLYFPLGGSRTGTLRTLRNLLLVWLATGLWHGASWNYVLWGLYFGVLICLEKLLAPRFRAHPRKGLLAGLYRPVCLLLAVLGWVLFRAEDLPAAGRYFACLFGGAAGASAQARLYLHDFWPVLLLGAVGATPLCAKLAGRLGAKLQPGVRAAVQAVLVLALLTCSTVWLLNGSFQSFVYFQF